jgi:RimJ/RimL family protein N-acetyltransferase
MIKLVPITQADFPKIISWAVSEEFLLQWTGRTFTYPLNEDQLNEYYKLTTGSKPKRLILKAIDSETSKHIGNLTIDWAKSDSNTAALTCIIIGDLDFKGKGLGSLIINEACRIARDELGIKRLILNVFDFNKSAIKCYEQSGFKEIFREKVIINGTEYVNIRMEKLNL